MLTLNGSTQRFCDGVSRRNFLSVGALACGGLALPNLLRAEALAGSPSRKSIINIYLPGGPSHMDMFDLKPLAPREFRGEFMPIATNVPGMDICEHMPQLAKVADKFSVIRSITRVNEEHDPNYSDSGWSVTSRPMISAMKHFLSQRYSEPAWQTVKPPLSQFKRLPRMH